MRCPEAFTGEEMYSSVKCTICSFQISGVTDSDNVLQELADVNFEAAKRRLLKGPHSHFLL